MNIVACCKTIVRDFHPAHSVFPSLFPHIQIHVCRLRFRSFVALVFFSASYISSFISLIDLRLRHEWFFQYLHEDRFRGQKVKITLWRLLWLTWLLLLLLVVVVVVVVVVIVVVVAGWFLNSNIIVYSCLDSYTCCHTEIAIANEVAISPILSVAAHINVW